MTPYKNFVFQSGDLCLQSGWYEFDRYTDGSTEPPPALNEWEIPLKAGELFPSTHHPHRSCYWKLAGALHQGQEQAQQEAPALASAN